jgi:hypothetical protein
MAVGDSRFLESATTTDATSAIGLATAESATGTDTASLDEGATAKTGSDSAIGSDNASALNRDGLEVYARDAYERTLTDEWGRADLGGPWTVQESTTDMFDVASGFGTIVTGTNLAGRQISLESVSVQDVELYGVVKVDKIPTGTNAFSQVYLHGRRIDNNNRYSGRLRFNVGATLNVSIDRAVTGTFTTIAGPTAISGTLVVGDLWHLRVQIEGASPTTIRIRAWKDGDTEPTSWQESVTDSGAGLQSTGKVGVQWITSAMTNVGGGLTATVSLDTYEATAIPAVAPSGTEPMPFMGGGFFG